MKRGVNGGSDMNAILLISWVALIYISYKLSVVVLDKAGKL
jgi:hypothetical protein